jgi:hypothetical protein
MLEYYNKKRVVSYHIRLKHERTTKLVQMTWFIVTIIKNVVVDMTGGLLEHKSKQVKSQICNSTKDAYV